MNWRFGRARGNLISAGDDATTLISTPVTQCHWESPKWAVAKQTSSWAYPSNSCKPAFITVTLSCVYSVGFRAQGRGQGLSGRWGDVPTAKGHSWAVSIFGLPQKIWAGDKRALRHILGRWGQASDEEDEGEDSGAEDFAQPHVAMLALHCSSLIFLFVLWRWRSPVTP